MGAFRGALLAAAPALIAAEQLLWIDVPYVRQPPEGCGAAALTMVMRYWQRYDRSIDGEASDTQRIQQGIYSAERRGIPAASMTGYLSEQGFRAFDFAGEWKDIERHISLGRPLIVCLGAGRDGPLHYVVVAGAAPDRALIHDPVAGKLLPVARREFENRWSGCGNWALLAVPNARPAAMPRGILRPAGDDTGGNEYLGTLYFVEANYDAAVKYWNKIGKPRIDTVEYVPALPLDPLLANRLQPVSRGDLLTPGKLRYMRRLLDSLGFVGRHHVELIAQPEERYTLQVRTTTRPSFPNPISALRGAPFLAAHLDLYNLGSAGINWTTMVRFDAQKRRLLTVFDAPLGRHPKRRYALLGDGRREVWNTGGEDFRVNRQEAGVDLRLTAENGVDWRNGFLVTSRDFDGSSGMAEGAGLKYRTGFGKRLLDWPERAVTADSHVRWELGRLLSGTRDLYSRLQGSAAVEWHPRGRRSAWRLSLHAYAGTSPGQPPFDELFMLGLERDNDLPLRGHIGTSSGKKGASPLARDYVLLNFDVERTIYRHGLFTVSAGPFLDSARGWRTWRPEDANRTFWDAGGQVKLRVAGVWEAVFSYGRDLRQGGNAFYLTIGN